ncbi:AF4/FMR2 family member 4-like [Strongylocentrotus purpuratus]|uniref:Uncharacterized protein n=1 Tax=Strongylocentrotus purpuratus TaxID=7668 RepID=A0A7M7SY09_STRPU|nr:AF4/FMR2 family member 4-like [Strongylocentrotus purpuratus]
MVLVVFTEHTGSARDSMPRSIPPPVPYRRRKSKSSKSSWLSSFRRNPQAENRPLPDVPKDTTPIISPSGQPSGQASGIYITPTSSARVNADVVRSGHRKSRSSSSSSKKKTRRKSANDMMSSSSRDHSPSGSGLSLDCAIDADGPPLPPRTPSLEKLEKHRSKSGKHSKEYRDPLSPKSPKDRSVSFEGDSDVGATSGKHRSKVRRHHSSSKHKHGEKKMRQGRKMSAPSIMEQNDSGAQQIADHSFEEATDYLIPNSTREDSSKDDTDDALSLTSSVTSPLTSPTVLTFTSPLKPCRKSNTSSYTSTKRVRLPERTFNSPAELPRDMSELTCGELGQALRLLHMREETVERFAKHLVNGALLEKMDADILKSEFELTHFELFKIRQFVSGWRP